MIKVGSDPILECSSKGEKRLSAFFARIKRRNNKSIEELYQARKMFRVGDQIESGLSIKEAKGRLAINQEDCRLFYSQLWDEYFQENPDLFDLTKHYNGFSDMFGKPGSVCQAIEVYRITKG